MRGQKRLDHYIDPNADPAEARLRGYGVPIWALIGHLPMVDGDVGRLADDYDLPQEAAEAALAYYARHREVIDARLLLNSL